MAAGDHHSSRCGRGNGAPLVGELYRLLLSSQEKGNVSLLEDVHVCTCKCTHMYMYMCVHVHVDIVGYVLCNTGDVSR